MAKPKLEFNSSATIRRIVQLSRERKAIEEKEEVLRGSLKAFMQRQQLPRIPFSSRTLGRHDAVIYEQERWNADRETAASILPAETFDRIFTMQTSVCLKVE
jgi:hypothetical protein